MIVTRYYCPFFDIISVVLHCVSGTLSAIFILVAQDCLPVSVLLDVPD
ncbi:MAG: hypothetical protein QG625_3584 [Cyanobacteriota bacterium erpe_2018_sw_39hr_WHONDRS-SW48-000098_B_bin.30]|nr:hypothetical protein [Cyanobacteriota bacterium erpe_2018_sw_39hr_WHONDRS-SW48-000098_B_bin.30]